MSWIEIDLKKIPKELLYGDNIIYGAGQNGKRVYYQLKEYGVPVSGFYDDDSSRWGEEVCDGKFIYSSDKLAGLGDNINCILASVFISEMEKRAGELGLLHLYGVYNLIMDYNEEVFQVAKYKGDQNYIRRQNEIRSCFSDKESLEYFDVMYKTVMAGKLLHDIKRIYCSEDIYFLDRLNSLLKNATFIDCGAFKGDTLIQFISKYPDYKSVYCFEADRTNYNALQECVHTIGKSGIVCENYALWDCETMIGMQGSGVNAKTSETDANMIPTMTIDKYFSDIKVDYIKMDIEGAELNALKGGMEVIKRDRPALAICIYHTMEDRLEIPAMLISVLENYDFFIRHHGYTYCDSVLYCVPMEKYDL